MIYLLKMPTIPEPILDYLASIDTFLTLKAETRFPPSIRNIRIEGIITDSENFSAEARIGPGRATYSQTRLFFNLYRLLPFLYQYQRKKRLKHYAVRVEPESPFGPRFSSYLRLLNNNDYKKIVSLSFLLFNVARMLYSSSFNDDLKKEEVKKEIEDLKIKNESFSFWYLIPISLDYKNQLVISCIKKKDSQFLLKSKENQDEDVKKTKNLFLLYNMRVGYFLTITNILYTIIIIVPVTLKHFSLLFLTLDTPLKNRLIFVSYIAFTTFLISNFLTYLLALFLKLLKKIILFLMYSTKKG